MHLKTLLAIFTISAASHTGSHAELFDRGGGLIYDSALNITWLQDMNYSKSSGYSLTGRMNWVQAAAWASNLVYVDTVRGVSYDDWRLPQVLPINGETFQLTFRNNGTSDYGGALTGVGWGKASELGYMYYVTLNNRGLCVPNDYGYSNICTSQQPGWNSSPFLGPFGNYPPAASLWTNSVVNTGIDTGRINVWYFITDIGWQQSQDSGAEIYSWAVRNGDVAAIPEPSSQLLILAGLFIVTLLSNESSPRKINKLYALDLI